MTTTSIPRRCRSVRLPCGPHKGREAKHLGYAAAGIPCYLLIDRSDGRVTLFTDPGNGDCTTLHATEFGRRIKLPAPFSFTLGTAPLR
ncbi:hypothetical protein ACWGKU_11715 [Kitasatospora sp. NPDC054768]